MSFFLTKEQIINQTKTVTRRNGWKSLKIGDIVQPVEKGQGLKKGEKVNKIGPPIVITDISLEPLADITQGDVILEGFPSMNRWEFIEMYCRANKCKADHQVRRIQFEYLPF